MAAKSLFIPLQVGTLTIKNRLGMSAMTRNRAKDTYPTELMKDYYVQRAVGGAGLIVTEMTLITRQGTLWSHAPGIWDQKQVVGWKNITDAVHNVGGKIYIQLSHTGRLAHPDLPQQILAGEPVYAPSAIAARGGNFRQLPGAPGYVTPTEIRDPWTFVDLYRKAASNAKEAGFDGVELHAASGNLINQFLDYSANQRTDKWGGSVENRARFGLEVLKAMKESFGVDVAVKVSPAGGYNDIGMPLQDTLATYTHFIREADKLGLAYITLVRYSEKYDFPIDGKRRGTDHDMLSSYRPSIRSAKVFLNMDVTAEEGERLVSAGTIDGIFVGFNWITHPDYAKRVQQGIALDNTPDIPTLQQSKDDEDWSSGYTDYPAVF